MNHAAFILGFILCFLMRSFSFAQDTTFYTKKIIWQTTVEDEILKAFLEKASHRAMDEINNKGTLSEENAIPLLLKNQFNHIAHLDMQLKKMVTKEEFLYFRNELYDFKSEMRDFKTEVRWFFGISLAYLTLMLGLVSLFLKSSRK